MHRETRVANYLLAALTAISLILLSLPLSGPVRAFKACAVYLLNPIAYEGAKGVERLAGIPPGVSRLLSVDMQNQKMLAEMRQAAFMKVELDALRQENQRLTQALGLKTAGFGWTPRWARIMERDPLHWYASVMVDAGSEQGVSANLPVLARASDGRLAAVGRVTEVRPNSSVVLLLTDELSSAAAYLSSSTLEGLVQGQGGPFLRMNYLNSETTLEAGESVLTSPTSATFPAEVLIGRVSKVNARDPFLAFQSVEIQPAVDASTLKELLILLPRGASGQ
jgi:rod shape-determining protein MreC